MAGATIVKRDMADRIAEKLHLHHQQALQVIQAFLQEMVEDLAAGRRLEFRDFGVFETVRRRPRVALNPKTLEKVQVPSKFVVRFKPGRDLKARVAALPDPPAAPA